MNSFTNHYSTVRNKLIDVIECIGQREDIPTYMWVTLYDKVKRSVQDKVDLIRSYPMLEKLSEYEYLTNPNRKDEASS